jgi:hypothetical protein
MGRTQQSREWRGKSAGSQQATSMWEQEEHRAAGWLACRTMEGALYISPATYTECL